MEKRDELEAGAATQGQGPEIGARSERASGDILPPLRGPLGPLVYAVARVRASVHTKLLLGFMVGALLLLGMAILSLVVINRMDQRVDALTHLQEEVDRGRQMEYLVTAQMHFRAMTLLTNDDAYNVKIAKAKSSFLEHLDAVESATPDQSEWASQVKAANARFTAWGDKVLGLYNSGDLEGGLKIHLDEEHPISHELEEDMRVLESDATGQMLEAQAAFRSDRRSLTAIVAAFSGVSMVLAVLMGFVMSLAFVRPVRGIDSVLARIAGGDFTQRVEVPNRDEFGMLSSNLNRMSEQLARLYHELSSLNETLQQRLEELQEAHNQLQEYAAQAGALATVQERNRLARELHDSVTQTIFSMTLTTETARIMLQRDPTQVTPHLDLLQELAQGALSAMRTLIQQLRLSALGEDGLVLALRSHLVALEGTDGLKVNFHVEGEGKLLSDQTEGLFRIAQEALNNVSKHAQTNMAAVTLRMMREGTTLVIEDQGVGFDRSRPSPGGEGFGLTSMRERVDILGGTLEVRSYLGESTTILVEVPQIRGGEADG